MEKNPKNARKSLILLICYNNTSAFFNNLLKRNPPVIAGGHLIHGDEKMKDFNEAKIVAQMAACENEKELRECMKLIYAEDPVVEASHCRKKILDRIKLDKLKALRKAVLAPFEDEARRMRHGDKVYFGVECSTIEIDWNFNFNDDSRKEVKEGEWCFVWSYQPKKKALWLCKPKQKLLKKNVMYHFSLDDMEEYKISRTEIASRK